MNYRKLLAGAACLVGLGAIGLALRPVLAPDGPYVVAASHPVGVMGTQTALTAVAAKGREKLAFEGLIRAEAALRAVEARMSAYIELSELARLNAAPAGVAVPLSDDTLAVLALARRFHGQTAGAFDVTCLPLFNLWGRAGDLKRLPTEAELAGARDLCGWDKLELLPGGARKRLAGSGAGLGGIAKGWGIDRAVEAMRQAGCLGGLVDVGGDVRCFGPSPRGGPWRVGVRNPFDSAGPYFGTLAIPGGAVCTSGNYERYAEIDGRRYSHIIDPRTGRPVDFAPSVTVVAPTTAVADGWATALSVLGPKGFALIDPNSGVEAMIVVGGPTDYRVHQTGGFARLLASSVPLPSPKP